LAFYFKELCGGFLISTVCAYVSLTTFLAEKEIVGVVNVSAG
jgi:hypothetical protein